MHRSVLLLFVAVAAVLAIPTQHEPLAVPIHRRGGLSPSSMRRRYLSLFSRAAPGEVSMIDQDDDNAYYAVIDVGTPPQAINVTLDTGSSDLWLIGTKCHTDACKGTKRFDPSKSSTYVDLETPIDYTYGVPGQASDGKGSLALDTVSMGEYALPNQTFGVLDYASFGLVVAPDSGLMGLSFGAGSVSGATPFWQQLMTAGVLAEPLFSFVFGRENNPALVYSSNEPGGIMMLGYTNASLYTGPITYSRIIDEAAGWIIHIDSLSVGSTVVPNSKNYALIDSGTSGMGVTQEIANKIISNIPGANISDDPDWSGFLTIPCNNTVPLSFTFSNITYPIDLADLIYAPLPPPAGTCLTPIFIMPPFDGGVNYILGDTLLKNVYSVFRYAPEVSIGFAQLAGHSGPPGPTPSGALSRKRVVDKDACYGRCVEAARLDVRPAPEEMARARNRQVRRAAA